MFKGGKLAALRRAGTAVLAGAVIGLAGATPALATDPVSATPRGGQTYGSVRLEGERGPVEIGPMWLDFGRDEKALAYCIDLHNPVAIDEEYAEGTWGASEVQNLGKVQWVLLHGYPKVGAEALLDAAGASKEGIRPRRLEAVAYAATQVAVWQFSDGAVLKRNDDFKPVEYRAIEKVVAHLTGNATDQPEPAAELKINPAGAAAAEQGGKAGPFTVTGPSGDITLTVTGGTAVDAAGNPVTKVVNGGQFFLTRDTPGEVTVSATAQATHSTGRVFLFKGGKQAKRQKLILAGTAGEELTAGAKATFTPKPEGTPSPTPSASTPAPDDSSTPPASPSPSTPGEGGGNGDNSGNSGDLPLTGASLTGAIIGGVVLLAAGVAAVFVVRRRRVRFTA